MTKVVRVFCLCGIVAMAAESAFGQAQIALRAVRKNPVCSGGPNAGAFCDQNQDCPDSLVCTGAIAPTSTLSANEGDIIVVEAYGTWPQGLENAVRAFQWTVRESSYTSGFTGTIQPRGFNGDRALGAFFKRIGGQHCWVSDYIFHRPIPESCTDFIATSTQDSFYSWLGSETNAADARLYEGTPQYLGSLVLEVLPGACGEFTFELSSFQGESTLLDNTGLPVGGEPTERVNLTINVGDVCPVPCTRTEEGRCLASVPNCGLDARQTSEPDGANPAAIQQIDIHFDQDPSELTISQFDAREVPFSFQLLTITGVQALPDNVIRVSLNRPISLQRWTCVRYIDVSNGEVCVGYLPGDASNNATSNGLDIDALIECLTGAAECHEIQCDIDRSGACAPADILRLVDLLNGAQAYNLWNGAGMVNSTVCPTAG